MNAKLLRKVGIAPAIVARSSIAAVTAAAAVMAVGAVIALAAVLVVTAAPAAAAAAGAAAAADAGDVTADGYDAWALLLFPQARGWTAFGALPTYDVRDPRLAAPLRDAYAAADPAESDGCAPALAERLFDAPDPAFFRVIDLDADGTRDVVYSGPAGCREGNDTIVWRGTAEGFRLSERDLASAENVLALRIRPGAEPGLVSVSVGCCADPEDRYSAGNFFNPYHDGSVTILKDLVAPADGADRTRASFTNDGETVLRREPAVVDAYDKDASGFMDAAVFGNILAKYLAEAHGEVVATQRDGAGREWAFCLMSRNSAPLRYHSPYSATAGWVLADETFSRTAPPFAPDRFPAGTFQVTSADYRVGDVAVRIRQARPTAKQPGPDVPSCSVSLFVRYPETGQQAWSFERDVEPLGWSFGLFVPEVQPIPDTLLVLKAFDYDARLFVIGGDGRVQDLPGGFLVVDRAHDVLFSQHVTDGGSGYVALDLRTGRVLEERLDVPVCGWYRKGRDTFLLPYAESEQTDTCRQDVAYVWHARTRRMVPRAIGPAFLKGAAPLPYDVDPRRLADCTSPTRPAPASGGDR